MFKDYTGSFFFKSIKGDFKRNKKEDTNEIDNLHNANPSQEVRKNCQININKLTES